MFLTGTTNIQAGNGEVFTLDYNALASLAGTIDPYFSDTAVFKTVLCLYQLNASSADRPQRKTLAFKNGETTDMIIFSVKATAGTWKLSEVLINDKDGGELIIPSSQIPNVESYELYTTSAI